MESEGTCSQADLLFEYVTNFNLRSDFEKRIHDQEQSSLRSRKMKFNFFLINLTSSWWDLGLFFSTHIPSFESTTRELLKMVKMRKEEKSIES